MAEGNGREGALQENSFITRLRNRLAKKTSAEPALLSQPQNSLHKRIDQVLNESDAVMARVGTKVSGAEQKAADAMNRTMNAVARDPKADAEIDSQLAEMKKNLGIK